MTIIGVDVLKTFTLRYPPARKAVQKWLGVVTDAQWPSFAVVKQTFLTADYVAPYVVFNIGGNKYRVVAAINYSLSIVQIEHAFTHEEYDRWSP